MVFAKNADDVSLQTKISGFSLISIVELTEPIYYCLFIIHQEFLNVAIILDEKFYLPNVYYNPLLVKTVIILQYSFKIYTY